MSNQVTLWKSKAAPTAEDVRDHGRRLNGRPGEVGTCPKCGARLLDTHGAYCSSCGAALEVPATAKSAEEELRERAEARVKATGEPMAKALDAEIRKDPALYARHDREVKAKKAAASGSRMAATAKAQPAPPRMTAGQAYIEAAVAAYVSKTSAPRHVAYDAVMKTPEGRAAYLNHLNDLGGADCS